MTDTKEQKKVGDKKQQIELPTRVGRSKPICPKQTIKDMVLWQKEEQTWLKLGRIKDDLSFTSHHDPVRRITYVNEATEEKDVSVKSDNIDQYAVDRSFFLDLKKIEEDVKSNGYCMIHCPDYQERHKIYPQLSKHNSKWIFKSMINPKLAADLGMLKCPNCAKISPLHLCNYQHDTYDSGVDESWATCPECEETTYHTADDNFSPYVQSKNVIIVALEWKGKKYYNQQMNKE